MKKLMQDVRDFHHAFGHPIGDKPAMLEPERAAVRAKWLMEEGQEFIDATTIEEQVDACVDAIYFAVGSLVEIGVDPTPIWNLVQAANMAKLWPDGLAHKNEIGKVIKPDGWTPPDEAIRLEIERQIKDASNGNS